MKKEEKCWICHRTSKEVWDSEADIVAVNNAIDENHYLIIPELYTYEGNL